MGKILTGILVVLHMHGLSANQGLEKLQPIRELSANLGLEKWQPIRGLTAEQGLKDLLNPKALENDIRLNMEKFVAQRKRIILPLQPDWVVKHIQEKYGDLQKTLVMIQFFTVMSSDNFLN